MAPPGMSQVNRVRAAWRALPAEHRLAGVTALALLFSMLLPWYSTSRGVAVPRRGAQLVEDNQSAIGAFSFVEAAVLLVALGVLALLFARGERRAFHLPGGDGAVVTGAGLWACLLIVWRLFDKPELGQGVSVGLAWGIFAALAAAALLAVAGNRIRAAHRPEPPLPRAEPGPPAAPPGAPVPVRIPDERPHLAETRVLGGPTPLSREAAARDTAEFRAVPQTHAAEEGQPGEGATTPLPREEAEDTHPLPREDAAATHPVPHEDPEDTHPVPREDPDPTRVGRRRDGDDEQPTLPGMSD